MGKIWFVRWVKDGLGGSVLFIHACGEFTCSNKFQGWLNVLVMVV